MNIEINKNKEETFKEKNSLVLPVNDKITNNFYKIKNLRDNN